MFIDIKRELNKKLTHIWWPALIIEFSTCRGKYFLADLVIPGIINDPIATITTMRKLPGLNILVSHQKYTAPMVPPLNVSAITIRENIAYVWNILNRFESEGDKVLDEIKDKDELLKVILNRTLRSILKEILNSMCITENTIISSNYPTYYLAGIDIKKPKFSMYIGSKVLNSINHENYLKTNSKLREYIMPYIKYGYKPS